MSTKHPNLSNNSLSAILWSKNAFHEKSTSSTENPNNYKSIFPWDNYPVSVYRSAICMFPLLSQNYNDKYTQEL